MSTKFTLLNRKLGAARGTVTRTCQSIELLLNTESPDKVQLVTMKGALISQNDRLERLNMELDSLVDEIDERDFNEQLEKIENYREKVDNILSKINVIEAKKNIDNVEKCSIQLPKLSLPTFDGNVLNWNDFYESFSVCINNRGLTDVERFQYLKSSLIGDALLILDGLPLNAANYTVAMDLLKSRFGSKRRLSRAHVRALLNLKEPNYKNATSLRFFVDTVNKHTRGLESLDIFSEHYQLFLCETLLWKMPKEVKHEFAKLSDETAGLNELLSILENEAKTQELIPLNESVKIEPSQLSHVHHRSERPKLNRSFQTKSSEVFCHNCSAKDHFIYNCPKFKQSTVSQRLQIAKAKQLCFNCLKSHKFQDCPSKSRCKECNRFHNTLLHDPNYKNSVEKPAQQASAYVANTIDSYSSILPIISIPLVSKSGLFFVGALLDSGSDRSFIRDDVLQSIQFKTVEDQVLTIQGFNDETISERGKIIEVRAQLKTGEFLPINLFASKKLSLIPTSPHQIDLSNFGQNIQLCSQPKSVDIIIGADNYYSFVSGESKEITKKLRLLETSYGWTPHGQIPKVCESSKTHILFVSCVNIDNSLDVKRFWDNETAGILPLQDNFSENMLVDEFERKIEYHVNRYTVKLPWRKDVSIQSDFKHIAFQRLKGTTNQLMKSGNLGDYNKIIEDYRNDKIIEQCKINSDEPARFIPHHAVIRQSAVSKKIRIVFDASSKQKGDRSINECLHEGPNLFPELLGILLRFRLYKIAFVADIQKAFLQICIAENDRKFTKFLWYDEINQDTNKIGNIIAYQFCRVPFGFRSSPFLLNQTIKHHLKKCKAQFSETIEAIEENIYVDDIIFSIDSEEIVTQTFNDMNKIFELMSMQLHKWNTNSHHLQNIVENCENSILGLQWNSLEDKVFLKYQLNKPITTKREMASALCSFFDPLGLFIPFTNKMKMILHDCWLKSLDWDEKFPETIQNKVDSLDLEAEMVNNVKLNRWIGFQRVSSQLIIQGFGDASNCLYSTCVYATVVNGENTKSFLLCAKSRIAPKSGYTIPRGELLAALLTARLTQKVCSFFTKDLISSFWCYSDSQVALSWIKNDQKIQKPFIQNRVREIRHLIDLHKWKHVESSKNPADIATRYNKTPSWISDSLWWEGPGISINDSKPTSKITPSDCIEPEKNVNVHVMKSNQKLIEFGRFSQYNRLLRTMWYVRKFCHLTSKDFDFKEEENILIKLHQQECFSSEIDDVKQKGQVHNSSRLYELKPFLDDENILRSTGRLQNSCLKYDTKHPIILDKNHHFSTLLLRFIHLKNMHFGASSMCAEIRQRFHILQCRRQCKSIVQNCMKCKRYRCKPVSEEFGPLPFERVDVSSMKPFKYSGVDYLGPLVTLSSGQKIYILLITCLQIRAVHLEVTVSLSSEDLYLALSRFISRRGLPNKFISDNGRTFKCAAQKLTSIFPTSWSFNIERAPWQGGVWERLVRCVKTALRFSLASCSSNIQSIETLAYYCENVVNSRPLSYFNANDEEHPITPNHFLLPCSKTDSIDCFHSNSKILQTALSCGFKVTNLFWTEWKHNYLLLLNKNPSHSSKQKIKIGDICLLNEASKRQYWPLIKIIGLIKGKDGRIRAAKILWKNRIFNRHVNQLYPLEV